MDKRTLDLTVVCFLWIGDRWHRSDLGVEYVNRLFRGVQRNISASHRFVCFSNISGNYENLIEVRPLNAPSWKGCLPKITAFDPKHGFHGHVMVMDIDTVVVGSLDDIASYRGDFCVRAKFRAPHLPDGDLVGFNAEKCAWIWSEFAENVDNVEKMTRGRERFFYRELPIKPDIWQRLFPGQLVSYKNHVRKQKTLPDNARLVSCHGNPRPHEINESWVKEHWI